MDQPNWSVVDPSEASSLACWDHALPAPTKTYAEPDMEPRSSSRLAPTAIVSPEIETECPK